LFKKSVLCVQVIKEGVLCVQVINKGVLCVQVINKSVLCVQVINKSVLCVQVIVPKRTALLLDRIMSAIQKAVEDDKGRVNFAPDPAENKVLS
jgi:hypothetical protein